MQNVRFGSENTSDFGLTITSFKVSEPKVKTALISIPGRRTPIDASEILGGIFYENRTLTITAEKLEGPGKYLQTLAEISRAVNGFRQEISASARCDWYWVGRPEIDSTNNGFKSTYTISVNVEPYQYRDLASGDNWVWDTFNFEDGCIQPQLTNVSVSGSKQVVIQTTTESTISIVANATGMSVAVNGSTTPLIKNASVKLPYLFDSRTITLSFSGTGSVTISVREESL